MGDYLLRWLVEIVSVLWKADDRPEARRFTLGCAALIVAIAIAIAAALKSR